MLARVRARIGGVLTKEFKPPHGRLRRDRTERQRKMVIDRQRTCLTRSVLEGVNQIAADGIDQRRSVPRFGTAHFAERTGSRLAWRLYGDGLRQA